MVNFLKSLTLHHMLDLVLNTPLIMTYEMEIISIWQLHS